MATYWVSSAARGNDDGSEYAHAKGTIAGGIALCTAKGDILNIVNDGDHTWTTPAGTSIPASTIGTTFTDYGTLIRGTDTLGVAALASVVASGGNAARTLFVAATTTGFIIVRNLEFDASANAADASTYAAGRYNGAGAPDPGPIRFEGCSLIGAATGTTASGIRRLFHVQSVPVAGAETFELLDCYTQNCGGGTISDSGAGYNKSIIGCLFYNDNVAGGDTFYSQTLAGGAGGELVFTNNTIYQNIGNQAFGGPLFYSVATGLDAGTVTVNDNLVFLESSAGSPNARFMDDGGPADGDASDVTIDYNALVGGPNVAVGDLHAEGWYHDLWATPAVPHANDQVDYEVVEATLFVDPSSTYAWDALSNGATITVLKDLRPNDYITDASTGGVIGALPAGLTNYTVTVTSDSITPETDDTLELVVTISNAGEAATSVVATSAIPSGLTYVSDTPSQGTFASSTGVWTVGSIADAGSATLTLSVTVDSDQAGNAIVFTGTFTSGDPGTDSNTTDDTDSVTITVAVITDIGDDTQPGAQPFLDVLPIYAEDLKLDLNVRLETVKNRVPQHYIRKDYESQRYREFSTRRIVLATNTTTQLNIGGIARGEFLQMEATTAIQVSAVRGNAQKYWPVSTLVLIGGGDFEEVYLKNTSTTNQSSIYIGVVD